MNLFDMNEQAFVENAPAGMRLHKLELYNWGTFDKKIWSFEPKGQTTLLTGESGSGKSTLVDALMTLFVSPRKAVYNKAADSDARERTVATYVMGVYGQKSSYDGKSKAEALRGNNEYSVILGTFKDEEMGLTVTMAVFFWFKESKATPERFYAVSKEELFIDNDFVGFGNAVKELKSKLKGKGVHVFDDYNHYSDCFKKELGELKDQAVNLFQQTISMKNVKVLTEFVRDNMIEDAGVDEDIDKLLKCYFDLNSAHEAVIKARKQLELLAPIHKVGIRWVLKKNDYEVASVAQNAIPYWFASIKESLYGEKIRETTDFMENKKDECNEKELQIAVIEKDILTIYSDIEKNGGNRLKNLEAEKERKEKDCEVRKRKQENYLQHVAKVGFNLPKSQVEFRENGKKIIFLKENLSQNKEAKDKDRMEISVRLDGAFREMEKLKIEIESLEGRTSNVPERLIRLRDEICKVLSVQKEELPFAGELIEVNENEAVKWEGAIERLMHSFGISLLVTESIYKKVSQWVDENQLKGRLVYFRVKPENVASQNNRMNPYAVANKLIIKEGSIYSKWLKNTVEQRFDHVCCEDLSVFSQEKRAITMAGQIKSGARHEKDDRHDVSDRTLYVLGFSNQKKIDALREKLDEQSSTYKVEEENCNKIVAELNKIQNQFTALTSLESFSEFSEIDVQGIEAEINNCQNQIDEITSTNSVLSVLNSRLIFQENELKGQKEKLNTLRKKLAYLERDLTQLNADKKKMTKN